MSPSKHDESVVLREDCDDKHQELKNQYSEILSRISLLSKAITGDETGTVVGLRQEIILLKQDMGNIHSNVGNLKDKMSNIRDEIGNVRSEVNTLGNNVTAVTVEVKSLKEQLKTVCTKKKRDNALIASIGGGIGAIIFVVIDFIYKYFSRGN